MEDKIQIWKQRNLTLFGKVLIIKSMVLSNITLQASVLPIPDTIEKKLNRLIFNYLWSSNEKIKRTVVIRTLNEGGLNVTDIESWFLSLKTAWIPRLYNSGHKWTCIFKYYLSKNGLNTHWLLATNFTKICNFTVMKKLPVFYREMIIAYNKCKTKKLISSPGDVLIQPLWGNENISLNKKCIFFSNWSKEGLNYVQDVLDKDGHFISGEKLKSILSNTLNWMSEYLQVKHAVKPLLCKFQTSEYVNVNVSKQCYILTEKGNVIISNQKSKFFYSILVEKKKTQPLFPDIWKNKFDTENIYWKNVFECKIITMPIKKISEFNFRLIHNILSSSERVAKWKPGVSSKCSICYQIDNIKHMLFDCILVRNIWRKSSEIIQTDISWKTIVVGYKYLFSGSNISFFNITVSLITYSIYKYNMQGKCNNTQLTKKGVLKYILSDIDKHLVMQKYLHKPYLLKNHIKMLEHLVKCLQNI